MVDYIVVGLGLSGIAVTSVLEEKKRSYRVFEDNSQNSSAVAGGIYNPVILKRFTLAWQAENHMKIALPFYRDLEQKLNTKFVHPWNVYRRFNSVEEQNNWFTAADKPKLSEFLDTKLVKDLSPQLRANCSFGKVLHTGKIDTTTLINEYRHYLEKEEKVSYEHFDYNDLTRHEDCLEYGGLKARKIIFCEGFGLKKNPFFNYLPLEGNKGEYITIHSKELKLKEAVKSSVFIMPMGDDLYRVGATYNNYDKSNVPTVSAKEELVAHLKKIITCNFEVVDQIAGIRPSTRDRKPMVGQHPENKNMYCCNGFGSRGVLIAPAAALELINLSEEQIPVSPEMDIRRFTEKFYKK